MPNPTIALIIDCSGSMVQTGYLPYAKTDACTFVNIMQTNDACSVIKFETTASVVQALVSLSGQPTKVSVCNAILGIPGGNMTDIGDALLLAANQIGTATAPRAMILLSDGFWNRGPSPLSSLPANIPVYTIALGNNGQMQLLQQIADRTGGKFNFAPGFRDLAKIYNTIVTQAGVATTVTNEPNSVNTNFYTEINTLISPGTSSGTFTVNWDNEGVAYTPNTPTGNQVNITLTDPTGKQYAAQPDYTRGATAVFNIPTPLAGTWSVGCWYAGTAGGNALNCVWGAFVPTSNTQLEVNTEQSTVQAGQPMVVKARFLEDGIPMLNPRLLVKVNAPMVDHIESQEFNEATNQDEVQNFSPADDVQYPRQYYPVQPVVNEEGFHEITVPETSIKGGYNIHIVATGTSPSANHLVQETHILSFLSL